MLGVKFGDFIRDFCNKCFVIVFLIYILMYSGIRVFVFLFMIWKRLLVIFFSFVIEGFLLWSIIGDV